VHTSGPERIELVAALAADDVRATAWSPVGTFGPVLAEPARPASDRTADDDRIRFDRVSRS